MCDGEPIWTQQGAVAKHVAGRKRSSLSPTPPKCFCSSPQTKGFCAIISKFHNSRLQQLEIENLLV